MYRTIKQIAALALLIIVAPQSNASPIDDFATSCSLAGWGQDSASGSVTDFGVTGTSPDCELTLSVSDSSWNNTLFKNLGLGGITDNFLLAIDFSVISTDDFFDDFLSIGLFNESSFDFVEIFSGYAADLDGQGSLHAEFTIDSSFADPDWSLDFNFFDEIDDSFFGDDLGVSMLSISSVTLTAIPGPNASVPESSSMALLALGFAGLMSRRKFAKTSGTTLR